MLWSMTSGEKFMVEIIKTDGRQKLIGIVLMQKVEHIRQGKCVKGLFRQLGVDDMNNAKKIFLLANEEMVSIGDEVQIIRKNNESCIGNIIDIGETFITIKLEDESGEFDSYFSELKDIRVIK